MLNEIVKIKLKLFLNFKIHTIKVSLSPGSDDNLVKNTPNLSVNLLPFMIKKNHLLVFNFIFC